MEFTCREAYHRPPQWYEREQTYLAAQKAMDVIFAYREKHKEAGADYYEAFKAYKNPEDYDVEVARRFGPHTPLNVHPS